MRTKERIPIVINNLKNNKEKVLRYVLNKMYSEVSNDLLKEFLNRLDEKWNIFINVYKKSIDLRVTQALVISEILPNYQGMWYYIEDEELMIDCGLCKARDIYFWGTNYDKNGNELPKTKYKLLKDLDTEHIKNILKLNYISEKYRKMFNEELEYRGKI